MTFRDTNCQLESSLPPSRVKVVNQLGSGYREGCAFTRDGRIDEVRTCLLVQLSSSHDSIAGCVSGTVSSKDLSASSTGESSSPSDL